MFMHTHGHLQGGRGMYVPAQDQAVWAQFLTGGVEFGTVD